MKRLFTGNIRSFSITNLQLDGENVKKLEYATPIVQKDALFYKNMFDVMISLDHDNKLPDFAEAYDVILHIAKKHPDMIKKLECLYTDNDEFKFYGKIPNREFKTLKKAFRNKQKAD